MSEENPFSARYWSIFFEIYEHLPRQGPGNRACAERALSLCGSLPASPRILDLGCGVGGQTLHLADLLTGPIIAVDSHAPNIQRLSSTLARRRLAHRVEPRIADMAQTGLPPQSFDLVWSEGALYNLGIPRALQLCRGLLRPGGYLAFSDAVWKNEAPPPELKAHFDLDYPSMGNTAELLAAIQQSGLTLLGHFTLPDEAWWDDFYTPMQRQISELCRKYVDDPEALGVLGQLAEEPEMHRRCSSHYGYEFCVARRPEAPLP